MKSKILLIVEGEVGETRILGNHSHGLLSLIGADYEIVPFKNPIYQLYKAYKENEYDDLVTYLRYNKGLKVEEDVLSKNAFTAIYLIFDFDPQDNKYSDETIIDLLKIFDNETELGKLYINYPMTEAFYHLESLPDSDYYNRMISTKNLTKYKKLVNTTTCLRKNKITTRELCFIIMYNYNKARKIIKSNEINHMEILKRQLQLKNERDEIFVLSTFPLIVIDYNYEKTIELLKVKLKNYFTESEESILVDQ